MEELQSCLLGTDGHPASPKTYPAGAVYRRGRASSIVEITRFELRSFTMND
jgi:hypothetical protein